jgi:ribosome-binding protein aMBF1 (putative translation factor)
MGMTPEELARVAKVREDFATGVAQERQRRLHLSDQQLSLAIGAAGNIVGRWNRRQRVPAPKFALQYSYVVEAIEKAVEG